MNDFVKRLLDPWVIFGFMAQVVFFLRFVVQWIVSERQKKSVIPLAFWYLSIVGSLMILVYAIRQKDPVFIFGQGFALLIYMRNIVLYKSSRNGDSKDTTSSIE